MSRRHLTGNIAKGVGFLESLVLIVNIAYRWHVNCASSRVRNCGLKILVSACAPSIPVKTYPRVVNLFCNWVSRVFPGVSKIISIIPRNNFVGLTRLYLGEKRSCACIQHDIITLFTSRISNLLPINACTCESENYKISTESALSQSVYTVAKGSTKSICVLEYAFLLPSWQRSLELPLSAACPSASSDLTSPSDFRKALQLLPRRS